MKHLAKSGGGAAILTALLSASPAHARSVDGWLAECTAVAAGSCTELASAAYHRQPIAFATSAAGSTVSAIPYYFGSGLTGTIAGRAVYDAAAGGNLDLVLPLASAYPLPSTGTGDSGDVGALKFSIAAMAAYPIADAFSGIFKAGSAIGATPDGSVVTAGVNLIETRGLLATSPGAFDATDTQVTELTGFSYQVPNNVTSLDIIGAGTLATGTVTLQQAPLDGARQIIQCGVTVTALTVTAGTGATIVGTAPSSCGPNASHELEFYKANQTWGVAF